MNTNLEGGGIPCAEQFNATDDPLIGVNIDAVSLTCSGTSMDQQNQSAILLKASMT